MMNTGEKKPPSGMQDINTLKNKDMKLIIKEFGDFSVGLSDRYLEIDCPFERVDVEESDIESFKTLILQIYREYEDGKMFAFYDDEPIID